MCNINRWTVQVVPRIVPPTPEHFTSTHSVPRDIAFRVARLSVHCPRIDPVYAPLGQS